jgi:hypothetical protein
MKLLTPLRILCPCFASIVIAASLPFSLLVGAAPQGEPFIPGLGPAGIAFLCMVWPGFAYLGRAPAPPQSKR